MDTMLDQPEIPNLLQRLDELVRWRPGQMGPYEDAHGVLPRVEGDANHVILGRRGSGKTRLLDELSKRSSKSDTFVVSVNAEDYKELTYPDILIHILREFLREFEERLDPPQPLTKAWWRAILSRLNHPIRTLYQYRDRRSLKQRVGQLRETLDHLLSESEELEARYRTEEAHEEAESGKVGAHADGFGASMGAASESSHRSAEAEEREFKQRESKRIKVERHLPDFKQLLRDVSDHLQSRILLCVDDFYFVQFDDQPKVVDYIHRVCKDTSAYLKVATIKHRSWLYTQRDRIRGVVPGHEIQKIDLDLPLGQYEAVNSFLRALWAGICSDVGIEDAQEIFKGVGFSQAVVASGGVPRDLFGIVKYAVGIARERQEDKVGKLRVNEAARRYTEETKYPELFDITSNNQPSIRLLLMQITKFARDSRQKNTFHISKDELNARTDVRGLINSLVDGRLLHLISDNTTNAHRGGRFSAYLLDVGLYGYPERRGKRAVKEVKFWERDSSGRLKNLERCPVFSLPTMRELTEAAQVSEAEGTDSGANVLFPSIESASETGSEEQLELLSETNQ